MNIYSVLFLLSVSVSLVTAGIVVFNREANGFERVLFTLIALGSVAASFVLFQHLPAS